MKKISIYVDGSSNGTSTGAIGWGWLVTDWSQVVTAGSEGAPSGTNNIAELQAAISGLRAVVDRNLHVDAEVELVSDSTYALNLANGDYKPKKYHDLVVRLQELLRRCRAKTRWVRGHTGEPLNEKADELAKRGRDQYSTPGSRQRRRSRKREERRRKRRIVKLFKQGLIDRFGKFVGGGSP